MQALRFRLSTNKTVYRETTTSFLLNLIGTSVLVCRLSCGLLLTTLKKKVRQKRSQTNLLSEKGRPPNQDQPADPNPQHQGTGAAQNQRRRQRGQSGPQVRKGSRLLEHLGPCSQSSKRRENKSHESAKESICIKAVWFDLGQDADHCQQWADQVEVAVCLFCQVQKTG